MSDIAELSAAMAKAFAQIGNATKGNEAKAGQYSYKYADLATVLAVIKPHLTEHGLWFTQRTTSSESSVTVETVIHHAGGAMLECGALTLPVLKRDPQGYGSAISYCRRYSLLCAFGVATEDDDGKDAGDTKGNKDTGSNKPAGPSDNEKRIRKVADDCIALHAKAEVIFDTDGDTRGFWEVYERAAAVVGEDKLILWGMLKDHSKIRTMLKEYAGYAAATSAEKKVPA